MPDDTRERLGRLSYMARREMLIELHVDLPPTWEQMPEWRQDAECGAAAGVQHATMEAARRGLVETLDLAPGEETWDEALAEVRELLSQCLVAESTAASLSTDLAAINAVLNGDRDAAVEEGEVAARVLALREERDKLRAWQDEITAILARAPGCPVPADEFSIEDAPALLAVALGLVNDAADYKPMSGVDEAPNVG